MEISEKILKKVSRAKMIARSIRDYDGIHLKTSLVRDMDLGAEEISFIERLANRDGRLDYYIDNILADELAWELKKHMQQVEYTLDIGAVGFLETMLRDEDGDPYIAEPIQFPLLIDPYNDSVYTVTRRGAKSFSGKVVATRNCAIHKKYGVLVTEQSWTIAKQYLDDVYLWFENNPMLQEWSGGRLRKNSDHHIEFGNRSFIMCYTASNLVNVRGAGVHMQINDEKSAYTCDTAAARIISRGQKRKLGRGTIFKTSGTPLGAGTDFHKDQVNPDKHQYYAPILCPMNYNKPICYDCEYFSLTKYRKGELHNLAVLECSAALPMKRDGVPDFDQCFKRIPDDRLTMKMLEEDWKALGKSLFMQEYMCVTMNYTGNAIPLDLINHFFDDNLEATFESKMPCVLAFDLGLTDNHNSTFSILGRHQTGKLEFLKHHVFPVGTPYHTRQGIAGVLETILYQFNTYPGIYKIVGDATGVGKPLVEHDFYDMCRKHNGFSNIVAYKFSGQSTEFMGKSQLWLSCIKPAMETGRVKSFFDRRLYSEMRAWQMDYDPSKLARPHLHPPKAGAVQSDDAWISAMLAIWGAITDEVGAARPTMIIEGIPSEEAYGPSVFERGYYG